MAERVDFHHSEARKKALRRIAGVMLVAAAVYLVGNGSVALWDRDEPRNAQTSRQMLRSGNWAVPYLYDEPRTAKPPLAFWLQASAMRVLGENSFAARLPSAVAMVVTQPLEGHEGPHGYHLATIWAFFLPWSLLLPLAVALA